MDTIERVTRNTHTNGCCKSYTRKQSNRRRQLQPLVPTQKLLFEFRQKGNVVEVKREICHGIFYVYFIEVAVRAELANLKWEDKSAEEKTTEVARKIRKELLEAPPTYPRYVAYSSEKTLTL